MNTLAKKIEAYFNAEGWIIESTDEVEICYHKESVSVVATLSGVQDQEGTINIELCSHHPHISDFIAAYGLTDVPDISRISKEMIWQLYHAGRASILCDVYDRLRLRYKKNGTAITAVNEDDDVYYPVTKELVEAADFIAFSKKLHDKMAGG